jgi:GNAT superfamily N-acetyltransferase
MSDPSLQTATAADANRCLATLTLAFAGDPASRWVWPEPQQYLAAFPRFAQAFGGRAFHYGTAHFHKSFSGVALWLPPGAAPDEESLIKVIEDTVADEKRGSMLLMFAQMDAAHPREHHWHLPLIGVDPTRQGRGIGLALLRDVLKLCDRQQVAVYLEATSPRNIPLYKRHGFEEVDSIQVADSPRITPMLRVPGPH